MSDKSKKKKEDEKEEALVEEQASPAPAKAPRPSLPRRVSFLQWATSRGHKARHFGGLRAWVKDPDRPRTEAEWDEAFVGY